MWSLRVYLSAGGEWGGGGLGGIPGSLQGVSWGPDFTLDVFLPFNSDLVNTNRVWSIETR